MNLDCTKFNLPQSEEISLQQLRAANEQLNSMQNNHLSKQTGRLSNKKQSLGIIETETMDTSSLVKLCSKREYMHPPLPVTMLASFPGSGNTWIRYVLERVTGIYTGSVYNASLLKNNGFPGEDRSDGTVSVVKTHHPGCRPRKACFV